MGKQNRRRSKIVMSKGKQDKGSSEAKEPVKVYKWDGTAVKNALDDAVKEVMTAKLPYTENFNLMDGRLVICAVAVGVAMFALLWDFLNPFPKSRPVLLTKEPRRSTRRNRRRQRRNSIRTTRIGWKMEARHFRCKRRRKPKKRRTRRRPECRIGRQPSFS